MTTDITKVPLSRGEEARLARLEGVVDDAIRSYLDAGKALSAIRDGQLYRATHSTFIAYVGERFDYAHRYAYRLMDAAETAQIVRPIGHIQNEAQARELTGLGPDEKRDVYQRALAETAGRPTAGAIRRIREQRQPQKRVPLPKAFQTTTMQLLHTAEGLGRLLDDNRFKANAEACSTQRVWLKQARAEIDRALLALDGVGHRQTVIDLEPVEATQ